MATYPTVWRCLTPPPHLYPLGPPPGPPVALPLRALPPPPPPGPQKFSHPLRCQDSNRPPPLCRCQIRDTWAQWLRRHTMTEWVWALPIYVTASGTTSCRCRSRCHWTWPKPLDLQGMNGRPCHWAEATRTKNTEIRSSGPGGGVLKERGAFVLHVRLWGVGVLGTAVVRPPQNCYFYPKQNNWPPIFLVSNTQ